MALNHSIYQGDKRAINVYSKAVKKAVKEGITHFGVNDTWKSYMQTWNGDIQDAAGFADTISKDFYVDLEIKLESMDALLPKDQDTTTEISKGKFCYLTTACTQFKGLPDDCDELTTLRTFRDTFLRALPDGDTLVDLYYRRAPFILAGINRQKNKEDIYEALYKVIRFCVKAVKEGNNELALHTYKTAVEQLNHQYG